MRVRVRFAIAALANGVAPLRPLLQGLMFNIMAGIGALGVLGFVVLRPVTREAEEAAKAAGDAAKAPQPTLVAQLLEVLRLVATPTMLLLAPAIIYTGFTQAFFPGQMPLFIFNYPSERGVSDNSMRLVCGGCGRTDPRVCRAAQSPPAHGAHSRGDRAVPLGCGRARAAVSDGVLGSVLVLWLAPLWPHFRPRRPPADAGACRLVPWHRLRAASKERAVGSVCACAHGRCPPPPLLRTAARGVGRAGYVVLLVVDATNRLEVLLPVACLFGLGDAIMNTQLYSILGFVFRSDATAAFAAFKLLQSGATGILFFRTHPARLRRRQAFMPPADRRASQPALRDGGRAWLLASLGRDDERPDELPPRAAPGPMSQPVRVDAAHAGEPGLRRDGTRGAVPSRHPAGSARCNRVRHGRLIVRPQRR